MDKRKLDCMTNPSEHFGKKKVQAQQSKFCAGETLKLESLLMEFD